MYKYQQQRNTDFMNEDYCSYEISKALKTCGFNELTNSFYDEASVQGEFEIVPTYAKFNEVCKTPGCECVAAPTLSQAQKWLRSKGIAINVMANGKGEYCQTRAYLPNYTGRTIGYDWAINGVYPLYDTYEKALSTGISKALESPTQNAQ